MKFYSLEGQVSYSEVSDLQQKLVDLRSQDRVEDTVLFLEHSPVVTNGKGLQRKPGQKVKEIQPPVTLPEGIEYCLSERGGGLTYHGPGQLVGYPICKLDGEGIFQRRDVVGFIRALEQWLIDELQSWGLVGEVKDLASGVWVGEAKIASIGIAVRKWVTYHGFALNVVNDLGPFQFFSPCGFDGSVMTRLSDRVDVPKNWRDLLEQKLASQLQGQVVKVKKISLDQLSNSLDSAHLEGEAVPSESMGLF